jgi:hypothetical protein
LSIAKLAQPLGVAATERICIRLKL